MNTMLVFYQPFCFAGFKKHSKTYHKTEKFVAAGVTTENTIFFLLVNASEVLGGACRGGARAPERQSSHVAQVTADWTPCTRSSAHSATPAHTETGTHF